MEFWSSLPLEAICFSSITLQPILRSEQQTSTTSAVLAHEECIVSGGSRIFPRGGREPSRGGREHAKFSRKLHEIERIWTPRGGRASLTPPLDPPMIVIHYTAFRQVTFSRKTRRKFG